MIWVLPLVALVLPLFLWPIELYLPYPYILEEFAKAVLIYPIAIHSASSVDKLKLTVIVGILFSLTESVLYLFNIYQLGDINTFLTRLFVTGILHIITSIIILTPALINRKLFIIGVLIAGVIHYIFNLYIGLLISG